MGILIASLNGLWQAFRRQAELSVFHESTQALFTALHDSVGIASAESGSMLQKWFTDYGANPVSGISRKAAASRVDQTRHDAVFNSSTSTLHRYSAMAR